MMQDTSALLSGKEVLRYLPQQPPFILVDTLWEAAPEEATAGITVAADLIFVENGVLIESGVMEHVAQTAAVGTGYQKTGEEKPPIGFIGAYKDVVFHRLPAVGETLRTTLRVKHSVWNCTAYDAQVRVGEEVIATMEIKLFLV